MFQIGSVSDLVITTFLEINNLYNATGQKVSKKVIQATNITNTDYLSGFQYKNNVLQFFPHAEGYVNATQNELIGGGTSYTFNYVYNYTDHLGNIRLSYSQDPSTNVLKIIEENHYYPFGLKHTGYNSDQMMYVKEDYILKIKPKPPLFKTSYNYKFGNKELQDELGLNMYDYGARNYDPALGRWMNIDPLAEKAPGWTPYRYAFNNPVRFIDPNGMFEDDYKMDTNGNLKLIKETDDKFDRIYNSTGTKSITVNTEYIGKGEKGTVVGFTDTKSADKFYEFAAKETNVEFAKIDGKFSSSDKDVSFVITSHEKSTVSNQPEMVSVLSKKGFEGEKISHSHPGGNSVPSGHYGYQEGNSNSLTPIPNHKTGDAENARVINQMPGFKNTKFEVYNPKTNTKTIYNGKTQARIIK